MWYTSCLWVFVLSIQFGTQFFFNFFIRSSNHYWFFEYKCNKLWALNGIFYWLWSNWMIRIFLLFSLLRYTIYSFIIIPSTIFFFFFVSPVFTQHFFPTYFHLNKHKFIGIFCFFNFLLFVSFKVVRRKVRMILKITLRLTPF